MDVLAQGGMGTIYRALDRELDREVAIKIVTLPELAPEDAERLRIEARILARLEHPGIVPVHDLGKLPDGRDFAVMKLVRGRSLAQVAGGGSGADHGSGGVHGPDLPLRERLRIVEQLGHTLAFAHARGVFHRDLKPENVMIGEFGETLLMDWGVASVEGVAEADGTVFGTPGYMAPEQAAGDLDRIDARTDVFGLGGILVFLLSGAAPFAARTPEEARELYASRSADPCAGLPRSIPKPLKAICARALAPDPADRYPTALEFSRDIARYESQEPVSAYREGVFERVGRLVMRYRTPLILIATYLALRLFLIFRGR
jgi:serine/threonine protein kinase